MRRLGLLLLGAFFLFSESIIAQTKTITGRVTDEKGITIPNVSVLGRGTKTGVSTNLEGVFSISVPPTVTHLVFSAVGYETQALTLLPGITNYNVKLLLASASLENVVVTGYTRETKTSYSGAVSTVPAGQINGVPNGSIDQILQGRVPGLLVMTGSGQPGNSATAVIRGIGTISGSERPLFIIDGIPVEGASFASISNSDIESVSVLKDASSTAIYGSRGANGVIVITTKRGRAKDRISFGVKSQTGFSDRTTPKFVMMNSKQRIQFEEEVGLEGISAGPGWKYSRKNPANAALPEATLLQYDHIRDSLSNMNVDWTDIFFRRGKFQEYDVSASGGSEKVTFYTDLNYYKQDGIALRSGLERYSLRNNLDFKSDRLTVAISSSINYSQSSFIENEATTAITNPFAAAYYALPYEQPYIRDTLVHPGLATRFGVLDLREGTSALERLLSTTSLRNELKGVISANARYRIVDGLSIVTTGGLDFQERLTQRFIKPNSYTGGLVAGGKGSFSEGVGRIYTLFGNAGLNYSNTFGGVHKIDILGIYESLKRTTRAFASVGYGINPLLPNTPAGITAGSTAGFIPTFTGSRTQRALQSAIGIAKYSYDNKYTVDLSYRYDGSSTVGEVNRWKGFYSAGLTWGIYKEQFLQNVNWLSLLTLRASYGKSASPFPDGTNFGYLSTYGVTNYAGEQGTVVEKVADRKYDWEYAKMLNIGTDFALFNNRVRGSIDVYNKRTENLFVDKSVSGTGGVPGNTININGGVMQNRGIELALDFDLISTKDLLWTVGGNMSYNKNKILNLGQVNEFELGTSIIRVGLPYGTHYIPKWGGVDASTGKPLYYNRDGSVTTSYNRTLQNVAEFGTYIPKIEGGFNTGVSYKGFQLDGFFSFVYGNKRYNNEDFFNENPSFVTSNQSVKWFDRWKKPGDVTNFQSATTARSFSSKDVQDASFLRFRNLTFSYNLPASLLQHTKGITGVRFFIQGQNLYTWTKWTGFDPEDGDNIAKFDYPVPRTITFGLNINL